MNFQFAARCKYIVVSFAVQAVLNYFYSDCQVGLEATFLWYFVIYTQFVQQVK